MDRNYDISEYDASDEDIRAIFRSVKIIAIVGLSRSEGAVSYKVASYLQDHGYRIIPVRPKAKEILGEKVYATLEDVPEKVDVINIFRKAEEVPDIVHSAVAVGAKVIWMQKGIINNLAAAMAHEAGLQVILNKCIMKEHKKFEIGPPL